MSSAALPATIGHRNRAVARMITNRAQAMAAAVEANALRRAMKMIEAPRMVRTIGIQDSNRFSCRPVETRSTTGSKESRKVGWKATSVKDPVSAVNAMGASMIQLLTAVPMTASGLRMASGPQPRS